MKKNYTSLKIFGGYMLILLLMLMSSSAYGQSPCGDDGLCVVQFNAGFNEANKVTWLGELNDCEGKQSLKYNFKNHRSVRVAPYRIIYRLEEKKIIINCFDHRKDVYH